MTDDATTPAPAIRVLGHATPEEVAAIVAVLTAAAADEQPEPARAGSRWASPAGALRTPVPHGPGAWRTPLRP
jgi:hypothetical protein